MDCMLHQCQNTCPLSYCTRCGKYICDVPIEILGDYVYCVGCKPTPLQLDDYKNCNEPMLNGVPVSRLTKYETKPSDDIDLMDLTDK